MQSIGQANATVGEKSFSVAINIDTNGNQLIFTCTASAGDKTLSTTYTFAISSTAADPLTMSFFHVGAKEVCIAGCVVKAFIPPVYECIQKHGPDIGEIKDCLLRQGVSITADALACIMECEMTHP